MSTDVVVDLYLNKRRSVREISQETGISFWKTRSSLLAAGITLRTKAEGARAMRENARGAPRPSTDTLRRWYWDEGQSLILIARRCGVSETTVGDWFVEHGIPRRNMSDAAGLAYEKCRSNIGKGHSNIKAAQAYWRQYPEELREVTRRAGAAHAAWLRFESAVTLQCVQCGRSFRRRGSRVRVNEQRRSSPCCGKKCRNERLHKVNRDRNAVLNAVREELRDLEQKAGRHVGANPDG